MIGHLYIYCAVPYVTSPRIVAGNIANPSQGILNGCSPKQTFTRLGACQWIFKFVRAITRGVFRRCFRRLSVLLARLDVPDGYEAIPPLSLVNDDAGEVDWNRLWILEEMSSSRSSSHSMRTNKWHQSRQTVDSPTKH